MPEDEIGLLYSKATGIVLRTINPGPGEQPHLDWLQNNLPTGTKLLRLNKMAIGADDYNCPNLDRLISHVRKSLGINLFFGVPCSVLDPHNKVINRIVCCPVLYRSAIAANPATAKWSLIERLGETGYIYDPVTQTFVSPVSCEISY